MSLCVRPFRSRACPELITQGSPRLELNRVVERRFLLANSSAGAVGAALVALLECSVQTEGNGAFLQFQAGGKDRCVFTCCCTLLCALGSLTWFLQPVKFILYSPYFHYSSRRNRACCLCRPTFICTSHLCVDIHMIRHVLIYSSTCLRCKNILRVFISDAAAIGAAALYSILLLALSYWLATPPPPAAVQRAVEKHAAFQYLWALTFADVLVDRGAVTAKVSAISSSIACSPACIASSG